MGNVHRMFITYTHRTKESRNTKNIYDFLVQVRNFLLLLSLKVLRHKERDTHSFYAGFSICPPPNMCGTRHNATGLASMSKRKSPFFFRRQDSTHWLFQNPPNPPSASGAWRHSHPLVHLSIWDFYFDICERHILPARTSTPARIFAPN